MQSKALEAIVKERERQIELGWTPEHDLEHSDGELADAAACYAAGSCSLKWLGGYIWPWEGLWKSETPRIRMLAKAGACILAEMERLYREEERELSSAKGDGEK